MTGREAADDARALEARLRRLEQVAESAPDYIIQCDLDGTIVYMNRPPPGLALSSVVGASIEAMMRPEDRKAVRDCIARVIETASVHSYESVGSISGRHYVNRVSPVIEGGAVTSVILVTHDYSDRKRLEDSLRASEARFRALVEASFEGLVISIDNVIVDCNNAFADILGYPREALIGKRPSQLAPAETAETIAQKQATRDERPYRVVATHRDGHTVPLELVSRNIVWADRAARVTAIRDLTERERVDAERKRLEEQVRHVQRLKTLGVLAGGIAHDFNNLLQVIRAEIDRLGRVLPADIERDSLARLRLVTARASELTGQLLAYGGKLPVRTELIDIAQLVREMSQLLMLSGRGAALSVDAEVEGAMVRGDPAQLRQVVMNLVVNAAESLSPSGGKVALRVRVGQKGAEALAAAVLDASTGPGCFVSVEVVDDGAGIAPEIIDRIFDPFYSTKFQGRGLGLASVLGIVHSHGGALELHSRVGEGTRFVVHLPCAGDQRLAAPEPEPAPRKPEKGLVLLVDDEPMLLDVLASLLDDLGVATIAASSKREALERFSAKKHDVSLAIVDFTMPDGPATAFVAELRSMRPDLPIVVMSGYTGRTITDALPDVRFLAKPFSMRELEALLASLMPRS